MPQSVEKGGAVRGPAPQGSSNVATLCPERDSSLQRREVAGSGIVMSAPLQATSATGENVVSLEVDIEHALRLEIKAVNLSLIDAENCQQQYEKRLERACANLLIDGERIPALDQSALSMMQEAYLNASTATIIGAEKIIILEAQRNRLKLRLREMTGWNSRTHITDLPRAA